MQPVWSSLWLGIRTTPYNVPLGILQSMVNPSLAPTQPEGLELPTFSYGGEGIPRVLKQYRFSLYGYIFPIWWSNQLNQSERVIYTRLAWITTDSDNGLVSSLWQPIAWTNFDLWLTSPLGTNCSDFFLAFENDMQIVVILSRPQCVKSFISSRTSLSRLFKPVAYSETTCVPNLSIDLLLKITLQHESMISNEMITKCCNHLLRYCWA